MKLFLAINLFILTMHVTPVLANHADSDFEFQGEHDELPPQPQKPADLPKTDKRLKDSKIKEYGADYCDSAKILEKKLADSAGTLKPDLEARIKQELQVGRALCNEKWEFVGYSTITDPNERVIANNGAIKDGVNSMWKLMVEAGMPEALMAQNTMQQMDDEYGIFIRPQIDKVYGSLMSPADLDYALQKYEQWAHELNEWRRKNGTAKPRK